MADRGPGSTNLSHQPRKQRSFQHSHLAEPCRLLSYVPPLNRVSLMEANLPSWAITSCGLESWSMGHPYQYRRMHVQRTGSCAELLSCAAASQCQYRELGARNICGCTCNCSGLIRVTWKEELSGSRRVRGR